MKRFLLLALLFTGSAQAAAIEHGIDTPYVAPAITGIASWVNSEPLTNESLRGKVVLIDFWTYSCINCIRTLPHLKEWDAKYRDKGLVIIGVHSPEFDFERDPKNVAQAVKRFGITYPVALDSQMKTWNAFKNNYWPAHYLIDRNGQVVYTHFGEGEYDVTERNIQTLLGAGGKIETKAEAVSTRDQSPETYLGTTRATNFGSPEGFPGPLSGDMRDFTFPTKLKPNNWALSGRWDATPEFVRLNQPGGALRYAFRAGKVFLVMGPATDGKPVKVDVLLDGKPAGANAGHDGATIAVDSERLYELLDFHGEAASGILELRPQTPGVQIYAFTFGL